MYMLSTEEQFMKLLRHVLGSRFMAILGKVGRVDLHCPLELYGNYVFKLRLIIV